jgi:hypothetical protein
MYASSYYYVSSCYCICVLMLLYVCSHTSIHVSAGMRSGKHLNRALIELSEGPIKALLRYYICVCMHALWKKLGAQAEP